MPRIDISFAGLLRGGKEITRMTLGCFEYGGTGSVTSRSGRPVASQPSPPASAAEARRREIAARDIVDSLSSPSPRPTFNPAEAQQWLSARALLHPFLSIASFIIHGILMVMKSEGSNFVRRNARGPCCRGR